MVNEEFCLANYVERAGTNSLKWDSIKEIFGDEQLLPLWVADMDFKTCPKVVEALSKRVQHGAFGYGKVPQSYYDAFTKWQFEQHNMTVKKEEVRFAAGVVGALYSCVNSFTSPKESVIILTPVYYPFYDAILNTGRGLVTCELINTNGAYSIDFEQFEKSVKENSVKMFIHCTPHNPIGRVWREDELKKLFAICKEHNVLIVSDEIHQDFAHFPNKFIPSCNVDGERYSDMIVTLNSASKTFNLAGLSLSHTIIKNSVLREKYDAYIKATGPAETNIMAYVAMQSAYTYGKEWLKALNEVVLSNYELIKLELSSKAPKVIVTPLEGTYLVWLDLRAVTNPEKTGEFIKSQCKLAVDIGEWFSVHGKGFIRINLATHPQHILSAVTNIIENLPL